MKKILFVLLFIAFLSSCNATSQYELDMRNGKDAYKSGNYKEAINNFEDALIEKPTDEDAEILLEKSKDQYNLELVRSVSGEYKNEVQPLYDEFIGIMDNYTEEYLLNKDRIIRIEDVRNIEKLNDIQDRLSQLNRKYSDLKQIKDLNSSLDVAILRFIKILNREAIGLFSKHSLTNFVSTFPDDLSKLGMGDSPQ